MSARSLTYAASHAFSESLPCIAKKVSFGQQSAIAIQCAMVFIRVKTNKHTHTNPELAK
jgi:hypothetical protein